MALDRRTGTNCHPTSLRSILASDSTGPRSSPSPGDGCSPQGVPFQAAAFPEAAFREVAPRRAEPCRLEVEPRQAVSRPRAHRPDLRQSS